MRNIIRRTLFFDKKEDASIFLLYVQADRKARIYCQDSICQTQDRLRARSENMFNLRKIIYISTNIQEDACFHFF